MIYFPPLYCNDLPLQRPRGLQHAPQLAGPVRGLGLVPAPDTHAADEDPRHGPAARQLPHVVLDLVTVLVILDLLDLDILHRDVMKTGLLAIL